MDIKTALDAANRTATLRLGGPCATEHAAALAAAWGKLLAALDAAQRADPPGDFAVLLDVSATTSVGLAFFEVTAAAALALSRRNLSLARGGELPQCVAMAACLTGFSGVPGLAGVFGDARRQLPSR
jgi:hypothetical protein